MRKAKEIAKEIHEESGGTWQTYSLIEVSEWKLIKGIQQAQREAIEEFAKNIQKEFDDSPEFDLAWLIVGKLEYELLKQI